MIRLFCLLALLIAPATGGFAAGAPKPADEPPAAEDQDASAPPEFTMPVWHATMPTARNSFPDDIMTRMRDALLAKTGQAAEESPEETAPDVSAGH